MTKKAYETLEEVKYKVSQVLLLSFHGENDEILADAEFSSRMDELITEIRDYESNNLPVEYDAEALYNKLLEFKEDAGVYLDVADHLPTYQFFYRKIDNALSAFSAQDIINENDTLSLAGDDVLPGAVCDVILSYLV